MRADRPLRVCYFGTYRAGYARNRIMIEGLRRNGVEVVECHEPLWRGIEDRVQAASGGWLRPGFWQRVARAYARLFRRHRQVGDYDVLVVGYPGLLDVFPARLLSWLRRKPLAWDVLLSLYMIALERGLEKRNRLGVRLIGWLEGAACRLPDLLVLQNGECVAWFQTTYGLLHAKFGVVSLGADDRFFRPGACAEAGDGAFRALYYGTYVPNHGTEIIVEAARLLTDHPAIRFEMVGDGPEREKAQRLAQQFGLANIAFHNWEATAALVDRIACADVCLGIFGGTDQARLTLHNKVFEALAMGKPVITGDSPAIRAHLQHGKHVYLCERGNPAALAEAIRALQADAGLRERLAVAGRQICLERFTSAAVGRQCATHLEALLGWN